MLFVSTCTSEKAGMLYVSVAGYELSDTELFEEPEV